MINSYFTLQNISGTTLRFVAAYDGSIDNGTILSRTVGISITGKPFSVTVANSPVYYDLIVSFNGTEDGVTWGTAAQLKSMIEDGYATFQHWDTSRAPVQVIFSNQDIKPSYLSPEGSVQNVLVSFIENTT